MIACAAHAAEPVEVRAAGVEPSLQAPGGFRFFALFQARATANDLAATNPLLDGQVVGRLGGTNGIVVDPAVTALYTEQRANGFLTWAPPVLAGKASLTAAFEVDFAYGDQAYGTGGNVGGGFGADQVNLQTRRLHADFFPSTERHEAHVVVGLQFVADAVADPTTSTADQLLRSGAHLSFFGSEAAGVAVYGRWHDAWGTRLRYRLGTFTLVEQGLSLPDDVWLSVADVEVRPLQATAAGLHVWVLQDRSGGTGALGMGPTGALWELQGGPPFDPYDGYPPPEGAPIDADLVWFGADAGHNAALDLGPAGVHGWAIANAGRVYAPEVHDDRVLGLAGALEGRWRWTKGQGSVARAEVLYATASGLDPDRYGGVVTGNAYGIAGAPMPTHGTLLLFPDAGSIDRMVAVVSDLSGAGRGVVAGFAAIGYDPVPSRVTTTVGAASATTGDGTPWGTEVDLRVAARPLVGCDVAATAGHLWPGPAADLAGNAWAAHLSLDWLVF